MSGLGESQIADRQLEALAAAGLVIMPVGRFRQ